MSKTKPTPKPDPTPRCEVHDGYAPAVKRVTWNGVPRWVCQTCLDGR